MKRRTARAMMTAMVAVVICMSGAAKANPGECIGGVTWLYCGEHVSAKDLPLHFTYSPSGKPASVGDIVLAIQFEAAQWDAAWPGAKVCTPLCYDGTGSGTAAQDGRNMIVWGSPSLCGGGATAVAVTCLYDEPGTHHIVEADIILNPAKKWHDGFGADLAPGEANAFVSPFGSQILVDWYDVGSVIAHEFGHAIGLEHIGGATSSFPTDLRDAPSFTQTMYAWYFPGTTNKQSLDSGDITGLQAVAVDSYRD